MPYLIQGLTQQTLIISVPTAYNGYKEETGNILYRDLTVIIREANFKIINGFFNEEINLQAL